MVLMTFNQWLAIPNPDYPKKSPDKWVKPIDISVVTMASRLSDHLALSRVKEYENAYHEKFPRMGLEFQLLSISPINSMISNEVLKSLKVQFVEDLMKGLE